MKRLLAPTQFVLATLLALTSSFDSVLFWVMSIVGGGLLVWAVVTMRIGRIRIHPEADNSTELVTHGAYRWIRHPMYAAQVIASVGFIGSNPTLWRCLCAAALVAVLGVKACLEEEALMKQFAEYQEYRKRSWAFLPGIW